MRLAKTTNRTVLCSSALTLLMTVGFAIVVLNPLWRSLAIPGLFPPALQPPITAPVDGLYYIRNAESGYQWATLEPTSLWFHPLLAWLLVLCPGWLPTNIWFWLLSLLFAAAALPLIHKLTALIGRGPTSAIVVPLVVFAPGGLSIATGNAEVPLLFFSSALLLSVLQWRRYWLTAVFAILAMLTKPNALYLVPLLSVYVVAGIARKQSALWHHALLGICVLLITWLSWTWWVEAKTGIPDAYWKIRLDQRYLLDIGRSGNFFNHLAEAIWADDLRNIIRYGSALIIPLVGFFVIGVIPLPDESHRYAMAAGNLALLAIVLYQANPNKVIVYEATLPSHFVSHLLLLRSFDSQKLSSSPIFALSALLYGAYCFAILLLFVLGTPLRWYF